ncbi:hypothetical protein TWF481_010817 [Arthrobotrys musiformis]|uniref:Uncharacterized protein n=1 Tax=Arthrobotrys musiformis TaxID=47236 RepID=A0AAV9W1V2_9PEZI
MGLPDRIHGHAQQRRPDNANANRAPGDAPYSILLQENKMLRITILELQIAQCRNLALIDRFINGHVDDDGHGRTVPSHRQMLLKSKIEGLEVKLLELRGEGTENLGPGGGNAG